MPRFNKHNSVLDDGIYLPNFLFFAEKPKSKNISPAAAFNPSSALEGSPFQSSISPSAIFRKKTLIIDKNSLSKIPEYGERIALLKRLQVAGFKIFLRGSEDGINPFVKLEEDLSNISVLHSLSEFDQSRDYLKLAEKGVARDNSLLLGKQENTKSHIKEIERALKQNSPQGAWFETNDWQFEFKRESKPQVNDWQFELMGESYDQINLDSRRKEFLYKSIFHLQQDQPFENRDLVFHKIKEYLVSTQCDKEADSLIFLKALPFYYKDKLLKFLKGSLGKDFVEHLESSTLSEDSLMDAIEVFPERSEKFITKFFEDNREEGADIGLAIIELIENYPDKKSFLLEILRSIKATKTEILADVYEGRESEAIAKFFKLRKEDIDFNYVSALAIASKQAESKSFYSDFLIKIAKHDDYYVISYQRALDLIKRSIPDLFERIIDQSLSEGGYVNFKGIAESALSSEYAPEALRKITQSDYYSLEKGDYDFCLPAKIRKYCAGNLSRALPQYSKQNNFQFPLSEDLENVEFTYREQSNPAHTTYVCVSNFDWPYIVEDSLEFPNLTTVRFLREAITANDGSIDEIQVISFLDKISENFPTVKSVILPIELANKPDLKEYYERLGDQVSFDFVDYSNYLGFGFAFSREKERGIELKREEMGHQADYSYSDQQSVFEGSKDNSGIKRKNKIRIASNKIAKELKGSTAEGGTFRMQNAGEVLNDLEFFPQIRTAVIQRDVTKNLSQEESECSRYTRINDLKSLTEDEIEDLRTKPSTKEVFYLFSVNLTAQAKFRLPSSHANESLVGILEDIGGLRIEKGEDDFLYATSTRDRELTYVVKSPNPNLRVNDYALIPGSNPIKKVIDRYRSSKEYSFVTPEEKNDVRYDPSDHQGSMETMFEERSGVCRHRVAAVEHKLRTTPGIDSKSFRPVLINNNHEILEIKVEDRWVMVDLGGANTQLIETEEKYSPKATSQDVYEEEFLSQDSSISEEIALIEDLFEPENSQRIANADDIILSAIDSTDSKQILISTTQIENHANFLLQQANIQGRKTFYIDQPGAIDLHRINLRITDETPSLTTEGLLTTFLREARKNPEPRPLLVINWSAFSNKEKAALNTVIDENRRIGGEEIPDSIQIISLDSGKSEDLSFQSRHDLVIRSETAPLIPQADNLQEKTVIDLEGLSDWRSALFGKVILVGEEMRWQKSEFVRDLESGRSNFEILNLSVEDSQKLMTEFDRARAVGRFNYHGFEIAVPENIKLSCSEAAFDFAKFNDEPRPFLSETAPAESVLKINSSYFDYLIAGQRIADGKYFAQKGLIEKAAESEEKTLSLCITSNLSDNHWYCLFNQAKKHGVTLNLSVADQVRVPSKIEINPEIQYFSPAARIFVSKDADRVVEELINKDGGVFAVVDVEDFSFQDLIQKTVFNTTESGFVDFRKINSEFLERLREGEKIILKGEFSPDLLQMLEPILLNPEISKNLTLIIEGKEVQLGQKPTYLNWTKDYETAIYHDYDFEDEREPQSTKIEFFETSDNSYSLENSKAKADNFIRMRKVNFVESLARHSLVRLIGESGVGKSGLIREFENEEGFLVCRELKEFERFAEDESDKIKILFIDESNIEDRHFTMFSPLKNGSAQRILHQGRFYDLSERHRVVFACNPVEYGGGRFEQKLFADGKIPAFYLRDFPASYIYEKILKEEIYDKLGQEIKDLIPEKYFKKTCQVLIEEYQKSNSQKKPEESGEETVRELQEKALRFIDEQSFVQEFDEISTADFISTKATFEVEKALASSIRIRQKQREGFFPAKSCGLNGVILEGDSGIGKSVLIEAILRKEGLGEIKLGDEISESLQGYYKIDASLPLEQKREIITKAFEQGQVVWIDEINSCIDDGLEKILNGALTGDHPDGKKITPTPGFMLISSVNSAGIEGRSLLSPALKHRTIQPRVPSLEEYSLEDLTKIVHHWMREQSDAEIAQNIAQDFHKSLHSEASHKINLRTLRKHLTKNSYSLVKQNSLDQQELETTQYMEEIFDDEDLDQSEGRLSNDDSGAEEDSKVKAAVDEDLDRNIQQQESTSPRTSIFPFRNPFRGLIKSSKVVPDNTPDR